MRFKLFIFLSVFFLIINDLHAQKKKYNVLFIAVDDLNDWVGHLGGYEGAKTPYIDRLSKEGTTFKKAYCPAPICNPSRAALLTGRRPSTSGVYLNTQPWRPVMTDVLTLPQYFMANGYDAYSAGKIFHEEFNDSASWRKMEKVPHTPRPDGAPFNGFAQFDWSPIDTPEEQMEDYKIVQYGIDYLSQKHEAPFFLAIGLRKPHLPWYVPKKYFDMYPLESIKLPKTQENDLNDIPPIGKEIAHAMFGNNRPDHKFIVENNQWQKAIQGYLASITYSDAMIGRLLEAFWKSEYRDNTIVVLFGDHGWQLGEKEHWRKFALWEESIRVPLIIVVPGMTKKNTTCLRTVNLQDLYPTLVSLCGFVKKEDIEGYDLTPLLKDPKTKWGYPSITTYGKDNHSIRDERYHYIRYKDGTEELYDHENDPNEFKNLALDPKFTPVKERLSKWIPKTNAEPAATRPRPQPNSN